MIIVNIARQTLQYEDDDNVTYIYAISTAKNGPGEIRNSECTPRGKHYVRAKIGAGSEENTIFVGRRPTGEIYQQEMRQTHPDRDWILTRIMWLSGLEPGKNRLGNVDTMQRYVYIHGCPDEDEMGVPTSHGCIKMKNADVIELFDKVSVGTQVIINE